MVTTDITVTKSRYSIYNMLNKPAFSVRKALELRPLIGAALWSCLVKIMYQTLEPKSIWIPSKEKQGNVPSANTLGILNLKDDEGLISQNWSRTFKSSHYTFGYCSCSDHMKSWVGGTTTSLTRTSTWSNVPILRLICRNLFYFIYQRITRAPCIVRDCWKTCANLEKFKQKLKKS